MKLFEFLNSMRKCKKRNCNNFRLKKGEYCELHTDAVNKMKCVVEGCEEYVTKGLVCDKHKHRVWH